MIFCYWLIERNVFPTYFVPLSLCLAFEILATSSFLLWPLKRKKLFPLRLAVALLLLIGTAIGNGFLRNLAPSSIPLHMGCLFLLYSVFAFGLFLLFDEPPIQLVIAWVGVIAIREIGDNLDTIIKLIFQIPDNQFGYIPNAHFFWNGLIFDLIHLAAQIPLGFIYANRRYISSDRKTARNVTMLTTSIVISTIWLKTVMIRFSSESKPLYAVSVVLTYLFCILVLILRTEFITGSEKERELAVANAVMEAEQRQFEESRDSIELINQKVHDIKHRLDELGDSVAKETLDQIKSNIEIYDRPFHTGSQVLDTVLYQKSLVCSALNIRLSALGDARAIHKIPSSERFYFFSNLLDNAIEATKEVKDESSRIIGLVVNLEGEDTFTIESYNYFEGERNLNNGSLKTTKKEKTGHGLGLKSVKSFAEKYGGGTSIRIQDNMFFISVTLSLKEIEIRSSKAKETKK